MRKREIIIMIGVIFMLFSGCSRQALGYSILNFFGFTSNFYLQNIEEATELNIDDGNEIIIKYDSHPQDGNDISFYSTQLTKDDDIENTITQIKNNGHWNKTPMENIESDIIYGTNALEEADFPEINNGYYIFYWYFYDSTSDETKKVYGTSEDKIGVINRETCKNLGYFDTDTNILYFITFFENNLTL